MLSAQDLVVRHNDRAILDRLCLTINPGDRIGMVGRNGSGKSTLLRILAGDLQPDSGTITGRKDLLLGYLPQNFALEAARTVEQNIRAGARHITDLIEAFESLPASSRRHHEIEQQIVAHDGWNLDSRIATAMARLNCPPPDQLVAPLSGGEQRRVAVCRAIIAQPDLLLLDEPTNHLDTESIEWLADYLENYPGTFLLVTHDRYFLDRVATSIVEVNSGGLQNYSGNYTDYLVTKAEREAAAAVIGHKREMFLRRELDWVRRSPKARTTKSKSRLDRYFEVAGQNGPEANDEMELVIPPPPPLANRVVELENAGLSLGGKRLFSGLSLNFTAGQRLGIFGRNGLGKTSLLKILLGELKPDEGTVKWGQLTRFNYVDQKRLQLNEENTLLEEISDGTEFVIFGEHRLSLRAYLKRFLFPEDRLSARVKHLSGGERSRLMLARILKNGGNFLILDEPTNDLDLPTLRVLEEALVSFPGVVLVVSHDRYFLNRVCTGILAFEGEGRVRLSDGGYDDYLQRKEREAARETFPPPVVLEKGPARERATGPKPRKLSFKEVRELEGIEASIQAAEQAVADLEALFLDPDFHRKHGPRAGEITAQIAAAKEGLAALFTRWEELESLRASAEG